MLTMPLQGTVDDHGACSGYAEVPCLTPGEMFHLTLRAA